MSYDVIIGPVTERFRLDQLKRTFFVLKYS